MQAKALTLTLVATLTVTLSVTMALTLGPTLAGLFVDRKQPSFHNDPTKSLIHSIVHSQLRKTTKQR